MADRDTTSERKVDCSSSKEFKGSFKYDNSQILLFLSLLDRSFMPE